MYIIDHINFLIRIYKLCIIAKLQVFMFSCYIDGWMLLRNATIENFFFWCTILLLLWPPSSPQNFIKDLDMFHGQPTTREWNIYGDIQTRNLYKLIRNRFCLSPINFTLLLIIFYNKSHSDLYGFLAAICVIFINRSQWNISNFVCVLVMFKFITSKRGVFFNYTYMWASRSTPLGLFSTIYLSFMIHMGSNKCYRMI